MKSHYPITETESDVPADVAGIEPRVRAYRIQEVCKLTGLGRTSVYAAIKSGALIARRWNRCTIVLAEDVAAFLHNLPKSR